MLERRQKGEDIRYCKKCRSIKPDRAHHCRLGVGWDGHLKLSNIMTTTSPPVFVHCMLFTYSGSDYMAFIVTTAVFVHV